MPVSLWCEVVDPSLESKLDRKLREKGIFQLNWAFYLFIYLFYYYYFFVFLLLLLLFLGPLPRHMEVPRLGVESEL